MAKDTLRKYILTTLTSPPTIMLNVKHIKKSKSAQLLGVFTTEPAQFLVLFSYNVRMGTIIMKVANLTQECLVGLHGNK